MPLYGQLKEYADDIRITFKVEFPDLKEKQIKDLLNSKIWLDQKSILLKAKKLQTALGSSQFDDMNQYDEIIKTACKKANITLDSNEKKQIITAVSWRNPDAEKVIKKAHKGKASPIYGKFEVGGKIIEYKPDSELRDYENVSLDPNKSVNELNEDYFKVEVLPHVPDAWIDASKCDAIDKEIGIVGYEIPFNRQFYVYMPPRDLIEIDKDLDEVSAVIMELLREVHV